MMAPPARLTPAGTAALLGPRFARASPNPGPLPSLRPDAALPVSYGAGRATAAWSVSGPCLGPSGDGRTGAGARHR